MKMIHKNRGAIYLVLLLVMSGVFIFLATAIMSLAFANVRLARHNESMVSSLSVAEAGVNYYLWHLSHATTDYCDGHTGCVLNTSGPYTGFYGPFSHDFTGPGGDTLGRFVLAIKPPSLGGTVYDIKSVGTATNATVSRTVRAGIGIPSFAAYALLTNDPVWFATFESTDGPVHSNVGIRYDYNNSNPKADDIISSSQSKYMDGSTERDGVWTPIADVNKSTWKFPFPSSNPIVFNTAIGNALSTTKIASLTAKGINLPAFPNGPNKNKLGYYLKLRDDNKIDVSIVSDETDSGITFDQTTTKSLPTNFNGILYSEKPIWIEGTWNSKITIATANTITVISNLKYSVKDGSNKIGLISKLDIVVPSYVLPSVMEIDAAMASQTGHVWYPNQSIVKTKITIYGSMSSYLAWNWTWIDGSTIVGGFQNTEQIYDRHLTIDPPPNFPTTDNYQVLTWREE